jgi:putative protease
VRGLSLAPATRRSLAASQLRDQLGRLGDTPFALGLVDVQGLGADLFIPVSELNRLRQHATAKLLTRRDWAKSASDAARDERIREAVAAVEVTPGPLARGPAEQCSPHSPARGPFELLAEVWTFDDARAAAAAGASEIVFDPFLRHPAPPKSRVRALADELAASGTSLRLRTPTIVRPEERRWIDGWLSLGLPIASGHVGLVAELGRAGRDVVADYAVNCFNPHTAAQLFRLGARSITASVELTTDEIGALVEPWAGAGFQVLIHGRPEGMTLEHCVLSAAFDREVTTCRDLCVQKHPNVELTDPAGYTFPVATDSACRNRLLHSRVVEGSEFIPRLWRAGIRGYRAVFNVPGEPVHDLVAGYHAMLDALTRGEQPDAASVRAFVSDRFTRGHFVRAV